jgi:hypothetical protein
MGFRIKAIICNVCWDKGTIKLLREETTVTGCIHSQLAWVDEISENSILHCGTYSINFVNLRRQRATCCGIPNSSVSFTDTFFYGAASLTPQWVSPILSSTVGLRCLRRRLEAPTNVEYWYLLVIVSCNGYGSDLRGVYEHHTGPNSKKHKTQVTDGGQLAGMPFTIWRVRCVQCRVRIYSDLRVQSVSYKLYSYLWIV